MNTPRGTGPGIALVVVGLVVFLGGMAIWSAASTATTITSAIGGLLMGLGVYALWPTLGQRLRGQ